VPKRSYYRTLVRLVDWHLGLRLGQKFVVGVAVAAVLFLVSYLATLLVLSPLEPREEPPRSDARPGVAQARGKF
jgi:hypothetical protein